MLESPEQAESVAMSVPDEMSPIMRAGLAKAEQDAVRSREIAAAAVDADRRTGQWNPSLSPVGCPEGNPDLAEVNDSIADELLMCARYAQAAVGGQIDRMVMVGGESHSRRFAGHLARRMGVKSSVGDPIRRKKHVFGQVSEKQNKSTPEFWQDYETM